MTHAKIGAEKWYFGSMQLLEPYILWKGFDSTHNKDYPHLVFAQAALGSIVAPVNIWA